MASRSHKTTRARAKSVPLSREEIEQIAEKAAARAVRETLSAIGIRAHTDEDIDNLRKDLEYTRAWRQTIQRSTRTGWLTFVTVAVTGFAAVIWIAVRIAITGHP